MTEGFFLASSFCLAAYLLGLIWVIQVIHYPSFHFIDSNKFTSFAVYHAARVSIVVAPAMILELVFSVLWVSFSSSIIAWLSLGSVILLWGLTFFVSMPCHKILSEKRDEEIIDRLIITNWPRTILWTLRAVILGYYLF